MKQGNNGNVFDIAKIRERNMARFQEDKQTGLLLPDSVKKEPKECSFKILAKNENKMLVIAEERVFMLEFVGTEEIPNDAEQVGKVMIHSDMPTFWESGVVGVAPPGQPEMVQPFKLIPFFQLFVTKSETAEADKPEEKK